MSRKTRPEMKTVRFSARSEAEITEMQKRWLQSNRRVRIALSGEAAQIAATSGVSVSFALHGPPQPKFVAGFRSLLDLFASAAGRCVIGLSRKEPAALELVDLLQAYVAGRQASPGTPEPGIVPDPYDDPEAEVFVSPLVGFPDDEPPPDGTPEAMPSPVPVEADDMSELPIDMSEVVS